MFSLYQSRRHEILNIPRKHGYCSICEMCDWAGLLKIVAIIICKLSISILMPRQHGGHFAGIIFIAVSCVKMVRFWSQFRWNLFLWIRIGLIYLRIYASRDLNELGSPNFESYSNISSNILSGTPVQTNGTEVSVTGLHTPHSAR